MRTAVVILNWNTKEYLERFLPGLLASATDGTEIIVADSASTDGSMEMLSEKFPTVRQIRLDKNYGFTGGYNRAFKAVCELPDAGDLEYFVLINSDIEVPQDWLKPLTDWMDSHPDCAACAPKLHSWYEKDSFEYAGAAGGMLDRFGYPFCRGRVLKRVEKDNGQYDSPAKVFWATGACLMVRKTEYSKMVGLDDRFSPIWRRLISAGDFNWREKHIRCASVGCVASWRRHTAERLPVETEAELPEQSADAPEQPREDIFIAGSEGADAGKGCRQGLQTRPRHHIPKNVLGRLLCACLSADRQERLLQGGLGGAQGVPATGGQARCQGDSGICRHTPQD